MALDPVRSCRRNDSCREKADSVGFLRDESSPGRAERGYKRPAQRCMLQEHNNGQCGRWAVGEGARSCLVVMALGPHGPELL